MPVPANIGTPNQFDEEAVDTLADPKYHSGMIAYGSDYGSLSDKVWAERYMAKQTVNS